MSFRFQKLFIPVATLLATACGGGGDKTPDAGNVPTIDAGAEEPDAPVASGHCDEFTSPAGTIDTYPGTFMGDLIGAGADHNIPTGICTDERDFFPQEGEDQVLQLNNLTEGTRYLVNVDAAGSDVSTYVISSCTGDAFVAGECLVFADSEIFGAESFDFIAPAGGSVFLVVDHFLGTTPLSSGTYQVSVTEAECEEDTECSGDTPVCSNNQCVQCADSFDCTDPTAAACDVATNSCVVGFDECTDDDASEPNDGPTAATVLTSGTPLTAAICNAPAAELDFFKITVADGDSLSVEIAFDDANGEDLDLRVLDSAGVVQGFTFWLNPEKVDLSFLPAGDYLIEVAFFSTTPVTAAHPYTLTATVTPSAGCTAAADCDDVFRTQILRGSCDVGTGACSTIDGAEALALGAACDTPDDCTSGFCSYMTFQDNAATSVCTVECANDAECTTAHGEGFSCTLPFQVNFCHPSCVGNLDCGANVGSATLDTDEPWDYLTCTAGVCDLDQ